MVDAVANHADVAKIVEAERLVVDALPVTARLIIDAPFADRLVVDAFVAVNCVAVVVAKVVVPVMFADPVTVNPVALRLVVDALNAKKLVVEAFVAAKSVVVAFVVEAFVAVRLPMNPLVNESPLPERLVVDAFTMLAFCIHALVE